MANFKYGRAKKMAFYASYFWYKLILPLEVQAPRFRLWGYEFMYSLHKFRDYKFGLQWKSKIDTIQTRFGLFNIRVNTSDAANVSPAFERLDVNRLFRTIDRLVAAGKKTLFLDVGGDLGTYSVTVGNRFRDAALDVICFEPVPASCALLRRNIANNKLETKVEVMQMALMDEENDQLRICLDTLTPGSSGIGGKGEFVVVRAGRMDSVLKDRLDGYDAIVMKLDVEGAEKYVLGGATGVLGKGLEMHLLIEDFIDPTIIDLLQDTGWVFLDKLTDYNSFWAKPAV